MCTEKALCSHGSPRFVFNLFPVSSHESRRQHYTNASYVPPEAHSYIAALDMSYYYFFFFFYYFKNHQESGNYRGEEKKREVYEHANTPEMSAFWLRNRNMVSSMNVASITATGDNNEI